MLIKDFVDKITQLENEKSKYELVKSIIKTHYMPIAIKAACAKEIIEKCNTNGADSVGVYILYTITALDFYTSLELNSQKYNEEYDLLQEHGLIDLIFAEIESDLNEFRTVLNMKRDDYYKNNYTATALVGKLIDSINNVGEQVLEHPALKTIFELNKKQFN